MLRRQVRRLGDGGRSRARWLLAWIWRRLMFGTTVIAITGSVGKSTSKELLAGILARRGPTLKTRANQNDDAGVPRTLLALRPWHRYAVIEVGAESPGSIRRLANLVRPDIAVVLRVARTHTNNFATLDDTAAEKAELLGTLSRRGTAVLNGDDERVRAMAHRCHTPVVFFGRTSDCDFAGDEVRACWPERLRFTVQAGNERLQVQTQLVGEHWLGAVLGALAVGKTCGIPLTDAVAALAEIPPFTARLQPVRLQSGAVVIRDEETGSSESVDAMFAVLRSAKAARRILVFGDMTDAPGNSRKRRRTIGRLAADLCDVALFVDTHGHHAVRGAVEAGMNPAHCHHVPNLEAAADLLKRELRDGDLVFVKSRGVDHLSRLVFAQFGTVGCWTGSCRIRSLCDLCPKLQPGFDLDVALAWHDRPRPPSVAS